MDVCNGSPDVSNSGGAVMPLAWYLRSWILLGLGHKAAIAMHTFLGRTQWGYLEYLWNTMGLTSECRIELVIILYSCCKD